MGNDTGITPIQLVDSVRVSRYREFYQDPKKIYDAFRLTEEQQRNEVYTYQVMGLYVSGCDPGDV